MDDDRQRSSSNWVDPPEVADFRGWASDSRALPATAEVVGASQGRHGRLLLLALALAAVLAMVLWSSQGRRPRPASFERVVTEDVLAAYEAADGVLGERTFVREGAAGADDRAAHQALWDEWSSVVPTYWSRRVTMFEIASDGQRGVAAYVAPLDTADETWLLAVDPVDAAELPEYYHETLVHELAHIFTLQGATTPADGRPGTLAATAAVCDGPVLRARCIDRGSLLGEFVGRFWTPQDMAVADDLQAQGDLETAAVAAFPQVRSRFVSPYALTAPQEDIAETFVALTFGWPLPRGSVAEQKVDLLRQDAELFSVADRMRVALRSR